MNPQDPNNPTNPPVNPAPTNEGSYPGTYSNTGMDIPPSLQAAAATPYPTGTGPMVSAVPPVQPPPPPVDAPPQVVEPLNAPVSTMPPPLISPKPPTRFPKKIIVLILVVLFLGLGIFAFVKFVLPSLSGGSRSTAITWWGIWEDPKTVQPLIDAYQTAHPGVTIKYEQKSKESYRERLSNAIASGQGPDIMTIHNSWVPMFRNTLSPMPSSVFSPQEYQQTFYPIVARDLTSGASIVGIPTEYDGLGLYVNDEIFSTYAKEAPKTWNELRDTAVSLTVRNDQGVIQQAGVAMGSTKNVDHWQEILALLMLQNGAKLETPTGPFAEGALDFFNVFYMRDKVWDDTLPASTTMFANGKLAMMIAPSWRAHDIIAQNPTLKFRVLSVPQLPKNTPDEPDITYATYWANAVSSKSAKQQAAWDFLKYLSSKDSYQKLYDNAVKLRTFGEPFPRIDMRDQITADPKVGGFISLAGNAKSWYLADRTFDGDTGINTRMSKYFEDAINSLHTRASVDSKQALIPTAAGVLQVLVDYGLAAAPPPVKK